MNEKIRYRENIKGIEINNQPQENCGITTGKFFNDFYGTWYEVKRQDNSKFFMLGEPIR